MRYLVVIPCFNEQDAILRTLADLRAQMPAAPVLVVDDGSTDGTPALLAERAPPRVTVVRHPFNLGYGSAVQTGAKYAHRRDYDAILLFDADGQHSAADLESALSVLARGEADVVLGSRFLGSCDYPVPLAKRVGISTFRRLLRLLSGLRITDPTTGLQALNRRAIRICTSESFSTEFPDADMLLLYRRAGLEVREMPAHFRARSAGASMHRGLSGLFYAYKMTLSMLVVALNRYAKVE